MSEIKCTGNNGNGCFMDSCGHDCGCEGLKEFGEKLKNKEYKDLTEEEKLIINVRRTGSWSHAINRLWEIAVNKL